MPFTFSHPAVVLPLLALPRRWRSATGLIVGSMTPDFEKFIRMSSHDPYSHTWRSIFYFNLPLGLVLAFVFHLVVRDALIAHLPGFLHARFSRYAGFDWSTYARRHAGTLVLSLLVGTVSHIAVDSFTHVDGRSVQWFPVLREWVMEGAVNMRFYSLLQKLASVAGGVALAWYLWQLPREKATAPERDMASFWGLMAALGAAVVAVRLQLGWAVGFDNVYHASIVVLSAGLTSLVLTSALFKLWTGVLQWRANRSRVNG
ncbi:DUF4184 family protein [Hymenobacter sp. BT683]|uniref:DUF4184 family protein n=1 Tax=Hymenobacter jeongseonensis TaxID=2791027 RepID=A0ABS0IE46_9BACT|nr:DUF4184 family protein [Hymenobacter jeongseonensis]MBF9236634.1 DUF4184 family protein [Hymenobacter jeongseonensis]